MVKFSLALSIFLFSSILLSAQTTQQHLGWFALSNSTKINGKWGTHFDIQLRSQNKWNGAEHLLIRPGITYFISPNQTATTGYLYTEGYTKTTDGTKTNIEHRIWEQYLISHPLLSGKLSHRFRLEQRFMEKSSGKLFAQRFRYFFRDIQPLVKTNGSFTRGPFVAIQNELFLNIQNKNQLNGKVFDQNRAYVAAGARFSKKFDAELGYMNRFVKGTSNNSLNHILQFALYTRF
ncbi:MAG: DUF2490 domain-containing protein [Niabella sp.]